MMRSIWDRHRAHVGTLTGAQLHFKGAIGVLMLMHELLRLLCCILVLTLLLCHVVIIMQGRRVMLVIQVGAIGVLQELRLLKVRIGRMVVSVAVSGAAASRRLQ